MAEFRRPSVDIILNIMERNVSGRENVSSRTTVFIVKYENILEKSNQNLLCC